MLKIEISDSKIKKQKGYRYCIGKITVGDFSEGFYILLDTWNLEQYKQQWKEGLERIKIHDSSCLIADIDFYNNKFVMDIYYLYKVNNKILVQYQLFDPLRCNALEYAPYPYNPENNTYNNIPALEYKNEAGYEYQIWEADLDGIVTENL